MKRYVRPALLKMNEQKGYLLILVMVTSLALIAITVAIISVSAAKYAKTSSDGDTSNAVYAAEAGISDTIARLNANSTFTGYATKKAFYSTDARGKAEYTTTVTDNGNETATVVSTGYFSQLPSSATPSATRTIKALLLKSRAPVQENVLAGAAGITMSGNFFPWFGQPTAMQKGSVYSRGKIRLNGGATSIGTATDSARVASANIGCGNTSNFPQQCASNDPPIVLGGSWFGGGVGSIYGSVCATDQVSTTNIFPGPTGTGLQPSCIAPDYGMPIFDKKAFTDTKILPVLPAVASCPLFGLPGAPIWTDGMRITGSTTLQSSFGSCVVTLMGDVYIQGDLTIRENTRINVSNTLGGRRPVIVVNGKITVEDGVQINANSSGSFATFMSFWSTDNACSTSPSCTTLSSTHLYNTSQQGLGAAVWYVTANRAVLLQDAGGVSASNLSGAAFYSFFGSTLYAMTGNQSVRGIGGQEVVINPGGGSFTFNGGSLSVTEVSPFTTILTRPKYVLGDYQQSF